MFLLKTSVKDLPLIKGRGLHNMRLSINGIKQ